MKSVKNKIDKKIKYMEDDIYSYIFNFFNNRLYNDIRNRFSRLSYMYFMRVVIWKTLTKMKK
jgi:hypothetical protein